MPRILRTLMLTAVALTAWLVAAPAWAASAGLCGHRGTSEVAPPPVLIPIQSSLEQGDEDFTCGGEWTQHAVHQGQESFEWSSSSIEAMLPSRLVLPVPSVTVAKITRVLTAALPGVRRGVERPPRA